MHQKRNSCIQSLYIVLCALREYNEQKQGVRNRRSCRIGSKGLVISYMGLWNIIWIIIAIIIIIILLRFLFHLLFILPTTISGAEEEIVNTYKSISAI